MSNLIVIAYPDEKRAAQVLATLRRLQSQYLIDLDDAVYVTKDAEGKVSLHQSTNTEAMGAAGGALWGLLFGALLFVPVAGLAVGAGSGWLMGKLADYGIDDRFIKQLSTTLTPNSSAIFVTVRKSTPEKVLPEIKQYGGTVIQTSLAPDVEAKLREALGNPPPTTTESAQATSVQPTG
jgi:uncharacterized membrane protein